MSSTYCEFEKKNYEKLKEYSAKQKAKIATLKAKLSSLNESVKHCEVINNAQLE